MHSRTFLLSLVIVAAASVVAAQDKTTTKESKQTTVQNPDGSTTSMTITGEVVRYEPGHTIVIRRPNSTEATYTLDSSLDVPADVQVGRQVTLVTQSQDGTIHIRKITTTSSSGAAPSDLEREKSSSAMPSSSMAPSQTETRTETRSTASIAPANEQTAPDTSGQTTQTTESTTSKVTTISGTVRAYEPGQSITILGPDRKTTTYTISEGVDIPQDVTVGKRVTVQTTTVSGKPVVKSVTTKTTTTKTHTKTISPK
jgi:sulfite reductase alpha subunit-like flavoprotein